MKPPNKKIKLSAATLAMIALLTGAAKAADQNTSSSKDFNKKEIERCYGINSCKGKGQCGGKGHSCAGLNDCKGKGYINVEKGHCEDIQNGSLKPLDQK